MVGTRKKKIPVKPEGAVELTNNGIPELSLKIQIREYPSIEKQICSIGKRTD